MRQRADKRRGGSIIVMVALALITLLGCGAIAVDYGVLVSDANQMQRASDAAAVAGAQKLYISGSSTAAVTYDQYSARQMAVAVAAKNGVTLAPEDVTFPASNKIRVVATRNRSLFFAQALGKSNGIVTREATAGLVALNGVTRAVPLAMTTTDYYANLSGNSVAYELINNHNTNFVTGKIASLDLRPDNSGKSGAVFEQDLTNGFNGTIFLGQKIDNALNADIGSQGSKLESAMQTRMTRAAGAPWYDKGNTYSNDKIPDGDPRVMLLIVAPPNDAANNNPTLDAKFFVPVYLETVQSPGQKSVSLRLRILPLLTYSSQDPLISLGSADDPINGPVAVVLFN